VKKDEFVEYHQLFTSRSRREVEPSVNLSWVQAVLILQAIIEW
jgi:hypothetical protein